MMNCLYRLILLLPMLSLGFANLANAQNNPLDTLHFEGISAKETTGTVLLRHLVAKEAFISEDGRAIDKRDVQIDMPEFMNSTASISCSRALYFFNEQDREVQQMSEEDLKSIQVHLAETNTVDDPGRRDILFFDDDILYPVKIDLGDQGNIVCQNLYWNDSAQVYISGGPFIQRMVLDGETMKIKGSGFTASKDLKEIRYAFLDDQPHVMEIEGASPDS